MSETAALIRQLRIKSGAAKRYEVTCYRTRDGVSYPIPSLQSGCHILFFSILPFPDSGGCRINVTQPNVQLREIINKALEGKHSLSQRYCGSTTETWQDDRWWCRGVGPEKRCRSKNRTRTFVSEKLMTEVVAISEKTGWRIPKDGHWY